MNPFCCSSSCVLLCFQAVLVMFHSHIQPRFSFSNPRNYLNWLHFHFPESEMAKWLCWKFFPSLDIMWYEKVCVRANTWNSSLSLLSESVLCYLCNDRQEHTYTLTHTYTHWWDEWGCGSWMKTFPHLCKMFWADTYWWICAPAH